MAVTDVDEWLRAGVASDEVTLVVEDAAAGLVLRVELVVMPDRRDVHLSVTVGPATADHRASEPGPPRSNWDRMRIGAVEWRMVEPLQRWELSADDPDAGLRAYLAFAGSGPCTDRPDGYEQVGTATGQLLLGGDRVTLTDAPARRTHTWR